jgi:4-hydroxy-tetrahydrodipicolinate synthase
VIPQAEIKGLYVPIWTPMMRNGDDKCGIALTPKFYEYIDLLVKYAKGILVCGTTGQGATLKPSEQVDIAVNVCRYVGDKAQFIAGLSSNSTDGAVEIAQEIERNVGPTTFLHAIGADVSQKEAEAHLQTLAYKIKGNIIIYSNKKRNSKIELETMLNLADNPKIVGIKDSSMTTDKVRKILKKNENFAILAGNDYCIANLMQAGARGAIAATANIAPKIVAEVVDHALENDFLAANLFQMDVNKLTDAIACTGYVPAVLAYIFGTDVRSPHESILFACPDKIRGINKILSKFSPEELGIDLSKYRMC